MTTKSARLITFRIGDETYALDLMSVRQVLGYTASTSVPTAPSFIEGIVVVRSEVIPIIDLRRRLYPQLEASGRSFVLISQTAGRAIGLKVDAVNRIVTVSIELILPVPDLVRRSERGAVVIGVVERSEGLLLLLDVEALLTSREQDLFREAQLESPKESGQI